MNSKRLYWIDGLRGLACFLIFIHHFLIGFYPSAYYGSIEVSHMYNEFDTYLSQSPITVFLIGNYLVCIFCLVSGLVLSYQIFTSEEKESISISLLKRYPRLALPLLIISLIIFAMIKLSVFSNFDAASITGSHWLMNYYQNQVSLKDVFATSLISVWFSGDNTFSAAFWMLSTIFYGSFLSYILSIMSWKTNRKILFVYIITAIIYFSLNSLLLNFVLGTILAYVIVNFKKSKYSRYIGIIMLLVGLVFGGYPTGVTPTNFYSHLDILPEYLSTYQVYHIIGAFLTVWGIYYLNKVCNFLSNKICLFLGEISYAVYLIHLPILFSFSTSLFMKIYAINGRYQLDTIIVLVCSIILILILAYLFYQIVEKQINRVINKIFKLLLSSNK